MAPRKTKVEPAVTPGSIRTDTDDVNEAPEVEAVQNPFLESNVLHAVSTNDERTIYNAVLKKSAILIDSSQSIRDCAPMISRLYDTIDRINALPTDGETNPAVLKAQALIDKAKQKDK